MRFSALLLYLGSLGLVACSTLQGLRYPSVSELEAIDFLGKKFVLESESTDTPVQTYSYYPPDQSPEDWLERIEFEVHTSADGEGPLDKASRIAKDFKQENLNMDYALTSDNRAGVAYLDFFYPYSSHKEAGKDYLEFNAFKYSRDWGSHRIIVFHYVKNVEGIGVHRPISDVSTEIISLRHDVQQAMMKLPRFHL